MNRYNFILVFLGLFILGSCQSKKDNLIVSPNGYVLKAISDSLNTFSFTHDWAYSVNDGQYIMKYEIGAGASQILIEDRNGHLLAASGENQCIPQRVRIVYAGNRPELFCLMYIDCNYEDDNLNQDELEEDVGVLFDTLLKGELFENERIESIVLCSLKYDSNENVIEVSDSLSGKVLKAPNKYHILTDIVETGTMGGHHDVNFRMKNLVIPIKRVEPYTEQEYDGYTLLREINHISPILVEESLYEDGKLQEKTIYRKEVKNNQVIYCKTSNEGNTNTEIWENGYLVKEENVSKWNTILLRKEYTLNNDHTSYTVKNYKYDYTKKTLIDDGSHTISVSEIRELNYNDLKLN